MNTLWPRAQILHLSVTHTVSPLIGLLLFVSLVLMSWVGYLGSDDATYARGAYGWLEQFPYVGGHGTIRYTITVPMALSFLTLGETEFAMALPTLLYAAGLLLTLAYLCRRQGGPLAGLLIAVCLATNPLLVVWSSIACVDIVEAFFIFLSLAMFHRAGLERRGSTGKLLLAGVFAGLGFLTRETTVFLLLCYGVLFLFGFGIGRWRYFLMAAGFLGVWLLEVLYLWFMTGDPLYRINISMNHDSTIDRSIDVAGNLIVHPWIDPLLVVLFNQEFALLFWLLPVAALLLLRDRAIPAQMRSLAILLLSMCAVWFLASAAAHTLLPLNSRYFLVSGIAATVIIGLSIHRSLALKRRRAAWLLAFLLISGNLAGIYVENRNFMYGEHQLAEVAARTDETVFTDPMTCHRAELLLRWQNAEADVCIDPVPPGGLFMFNPTRAASPNRLMSEDVAGAYQPQPDWQLVDESRPDPKYLGRLLTWLGVDSYLPGALKRNLAGGHPGVQIYRRP